jgi:hypothetical protein
MELSTSSIYLSHAVWDESFGRFGNQPKYSKIAVQKTASKRSNATHETNTRPVCV